MDAQKEARNHEAAELLRVVSVPGAGWTIIRVTPSTLSLTNQKEAVAIASINPKNGLERVDAQKEAGNHEAAELPRVVSVPGAGWTIIRDDAQPRQSLVRDRTANAGKGHTVVGQN